MTTDNPEHIDWQQINRLPAFVIYKLVLLSLGRDCYTNGAHPFGCPVIRGDGIRRPEPDTDYTDRLIVAIENARHGRLPTTGKTSLFTTTRTTTKIQFAGPGGFKVHSDEPEEIPGKFDLDAPPIDAQYWIVDTAEFRRFCDTMEWSVPPEFLPLGYKKPTAPVATPAALPPTPATPTAVPEVALPASGAPEESLLPGVPVPKPRRPGRKPSWETIAKPYLQKLYGEGNYRSATVFYKAVKRRTGELGSPFKIVDHELFCIGAGRVAEGTFKKIWPEIRTE